MSAGEDLQTRDYLLNLELTGTEKSELSWEINLLQDSGLMDKTMDDLVKGEEDYEKVMPSSLKDTSLDDTEKQKEEKFQFHLQQTPDFLNSSSYLDSSIDNPKKPKKDHDRRSDIPEPNINFGFYKCSSQSNTSTDEPDKQENDYEKIKELISQAENRKSEILIQKLDTDEKRKHAQDRIVKLTEQEAEQNGQKDEQQRLFQVKRKMPKVIINFKAEEAIKKPCADDTDLNMCCKNMVEITNPLVLQKGQALLTFEEEEVAENVVKKRNHTLDINGVPADVKAYHVQLNKTLKFEVNTKISNKKVKIQNLPMHLPDAQIKDKLELAFYKRSIGGGEIESVEYDKERNAAVITFLDYGVVQRILRQSVYGIDFGDNGLREVTVQPVINVGLNKLQMIYPTAPRTVLLSDIKHIRESEDEIQDAIEIHFQKPSNGGGEVEAILYTKDSDKVPVFENEPDP
uniref:NID domain-containing protein n=1 Tax=Leptobrachium leishanense TaxID=445787 RepID=A0A8C5MXA7_9ANUR